MAGLVLTAVGSAAGPIGGLVGGLIGGVIDNALFGPGDTRSDAPPLENTTVSVSADGNVIGDGAGTHPRVGRLIWSDEIQENRTFHEEDAPKGFSGPTHTTSTINPTVTCCYSFGWGPGRPIYIKANNKIVADFRPGAKAVLEPGVSVTILDGTQNDPTALNEAVHGVGNAPAYRGQILVEFENLPVASTGNVPPQILTATVVMNAVSTVAMEFIETRATAAQSLQEQFYDSDRGILYMSWNQNFASSVDTWVAFDPVEREILHTVEADIGISDYYSGFRIVPIATTSGVVEYALVVNSANIMYVHDPDTWSLTKTFTHSGSGGRELLRVVGFGLFSHSHSSGGYAYWPSISSSTEYSQAFASGVPAGYTIAGETVAIEVGYKLFCVLERTSDSAFAIASFTPEPSVNGGSWSIPIDGPVPGVGTWNVRGHGEYVAATNSYWIPGEVDFTGTLDNVYFEVDTSGTLIQTVNLHTLGFTTLWGSAAGTPVARYNASSNRLIWQSSGVVYLLSPSSLLLETKVLPEAGGNWSYYEHLTDTMFSGRIDTAPSGILAYRLNSVDSVKVSVPAIITERSGHVGVAASYLNMAEIAADEIDGVPFAGQTSARSQIEAILAKISAVAVSTGTGVRFVKRGGATAKTIDIGELAVRTNGDARTDALPMRMKDEDDIPAILYLKYISADAEGETTQVPSVIETGNFNKRQTITTPIVMPADEAATFAKVMHQRMANGHSYEGIRLLPKHLDLEPGDIVEVVAADATHRVMVSTVKHSPLMAIQIDAGTDDPADSVAYGVGGYASKDSSISATPTPTLLILDSNLLRDVDVDQPGPYVIAFRAGGSFTSASLYSSATGETFNATATFDTPARVGVVSNTPELISSIDEWDTTSTLTVDLVSGAALSSVSDAEVLAGANACLYGRPGRWELIQAANWTLVSGSEYTMDRFLRGRRGSDTVVNEHEAGDYLVILDESTIKRVVLGETSIGLQYHFKLLGTSDTLADVATKQIVVEGAPLKPYTVHDLQSNLVSGDYTISYTARTRRAGIYGGTNGLVDGLPGVQADLPLTFEIDIISLANNNVLATKAITEESYEYTQAQRMLDGLLAAEHFAYEVFQMRGGRRGYGARQLTIGGTFIEVLDNLDGVLGWKMDETTGTTVADHYLTYDGTITETGVVLDQPTMVPNEAGCFDFTQFNTGHVLLPVTAHTPIHDVAEFSFSVVIDPEEISYALGRTVIQLMAGGSSSSRGFEVQIESSQIEIRLVAIGSSIKNYVFPIVASQVYHLVITVDCPGDEVHIYINGEDNAYQPAGLNSAIYTGVGEPNGTNRNHIIGASTTSPGQNPYYGRMQFPWFHSRVLTPSEVTIMKSFVPT